MMKRTFVFAAGLTAACLYSATLDEAQQVIRDYLEVMESTRKDIASGGRHCCLPKLTQTGMSAPPCRGDLLCAFGVCVGYLHEAVTAECGEGDCDGGGNG